jgi:hypothetical protein
MWLKFFQKSHVQQKSKSIKKTIEVRLNQLIDLKLAKTILISDFINAAFNFYVQFLFQSEITF